ncbi:MAG: FUSC family protein [Verrucomicrobiota bacterium]
MPKVKTQPKGERNRGLFVSLASRWFGALVDLDPGGIKFALAAKTIVAVVVTGFLCYGFGSLVPSLSLPDFAKSIPWFSKTFEAAREAKGLPTTLTILGAGMTLNYFFLVQGAGWALEFRRVCIAAAISLAVLFPVSLIGPGDFSYGGQVLTILWVPLIGFGLYLRRWGPTAGSFGIIVVNMGLFAVILNPTKAEGLWFAPTILIAALVTFFFRFLILRPSAVNAFRVLSNRFLGSLNEALATVSDDHFRTRSTAVGDGQKKASNASEVFKALNPKLRHDWHLVQASLEQATLESPKLESRLRAQVVALYRMVMAFEVMSDAFSQLGPNAFKDWAGADRLLNTLDRIRDKLSHPVTIGFPSESAADPQLEALLDEVLTDQVSPPDQKLQPMRIVIGLQRFEKALNDYFRGHSEIENAAIHDKATEFKDETKRDAARAATRLGLQALVATTITTSLQFLFDLNHAYWATLTVAYVLTATVGQTILRTGRRALGTAIGVVIAIAVVYVFGSAIVPQVIMIMIALVLTIVTLQTKYGIASTGIGILVPLLVHFALGADIATMFARIYETFIGVGVALLATLLIVPTFTSDFLHRKLSAFLKDTAEAFKQISGTNTKHSTFSVPLATRLQAIVDEAPEIEAEQMSAGERRRNISETLSLLDVLVSYIGLFESGRQLLSLDDLPTAIRTTVKDLDARINGAFAQLVELMKQPPTGDSSEKPAAIFPVKEEPISKVVQESVDIPSRESLVIVTHIFTGNRIGGTLNDLVPLITQIK